MDRILGLLKLRVKRGINLVVRDTVSNASDPYVTVSMGSHKVKTRVIQNDCNPEWNDVLTLSVTDPDLPVIVTVYDKDTLTKDDRMGEARIDIRPLLECKNMDLENLPTPTTFKTIHASEDNCYANETSIVWSEGKLVQDMVLRLQNVATGEIEIQIEWVDLPRNK